MRKNPHAVYQKSSAETIRVQKREIEILEAANLEIETAYKRAIKEKQSLISRIQASVKVFERKERETKELSDKIGRLTVSLEMIDNALSEGNLIEVRDIIDAALNKNPMLKVPF